MDGRIQRCRDSLQGVNAWIDAHLQPDGSWRYPSRIDGYFSIVAYASYIGRRDWARSILRYVERSFPHSTEVLRQGANRDQMVGYVPAWFVMGALDSEDFSLSSRLIDYLVGFQSLQSGGFFGSREGRDSGAGPIEFDTTAMCVIALAHAGRVEHGLKGADFLLRLLEVQPDATSGFHTEWSDPEGLVPQESLSNPASLIRWSEPKQHYYKIGLYALALAHAYGLSGDRKYLVASRIVYDETVKRAADLWTNTFSHKMCWAATVLHAICGEIEYAEHAGRLAEHLISVQHSDGTFNYPELWSSYPPDPWDMIPNAVGQFGLWIARALDVLATDRREAR